MIYLFNLKLLFTIPGGTEWVLILVLILLFFGVRELMRGVGRGIKEFNDGKENVKKGIDNDLNKISKL